MSEVPALPRAYATWRRPFRPTREGWLFLVVTFGVGIAAVNTGNNLLFLVLGMLLSLLVLSGVMSERALRGVAVTRQLPRRAFAGQPFVVEFEVVNRKRRFTSYSISVEDVVPGAAVRRRCYFLKVGPGHTQRASYERAAEGRGYLDYEGFRITTRYPFGLIEKSRLVYAPERQLVYPATREARRSSPRRPAVGGAQAPSRIGRGHELGGLRGYRAGDEPRTIHWKRTARLGMLVVRETLQDEQAQVVVDVDNGRPLLPDPSWDEAFELAIQTTVGEVERHLRRGVAVQVRSRTGKTPLVSAGQPADPIYRYLALLEPALPEVAGAAAAAIATTSTTAKGRP